MKQGHREDGLLRRRHDSEGYCDDHNEKRGYLLLCTSFRYLSTVVTAIWTNEAGFLPGMISRCLAPCYSQGVISSKQCYRSVVAVVVTHKSQPGRIRPAQVRASGQLVPSSSAAKRFGEAKLAGIRDRPLNPAESAYPSARSCTSFFDTCSVLPDCMDDAGVKVEARQTYGKSVLETIRCLLQAKTDSDVFGLGLPGVQSRASV